MAERIRVKLDEQGKVTWARGGDGLSVRDFVENYPCKALQVLTTGGRSNDLGEAVLSVVGGLGNLIEFNKQNLCGADENMLQQV